MEEFLVVLRFYLVVEGVVRELHTRLSPLSIQVLGFEIIRDQESDKCEDGNYFYGENDERALLFQGELSCGFFTFELSKESRVLVITNIGSLPMI